MNGHPERAKRGISEEAGRQNPSELLIDPAEHVDGVKNTKAIT